MFISRSVDLIKAATDGVLRRGLPQPRNVLLLPEPIDRSFVEQQKNLVNNLMKEKAYLEKELKEVEQKYKDVFYEKSRIHRKLVEALDDVSDARRKSWELENEVSSLQRKLEGEQAKPFLARIWTTIRKHPVKSGLLGAGLLGAGALVGYLAHRAGKRRK